MVRGLEDRKNYEVNETFFSVMRFPLIRIFLAVAIRLKLDLCRMDVKTAFLNGESDEEIYLEIHVRMKIDPHTKKRQGVQIK